LIHVFGKAPFRSIYYDCDLDALPPLKIWCGFLPISNAGSKHRPILQILYKFVTDFFTMLVLIQHFDKQFLFSY